MGKIDKTFGLLLTLIIALSCLTLTVEKANAQSISKPSVPEFTVQLTDHSYDVPPTTTTNVDPYNGKKTTYNVNGYHVENFTINLTIKNQPFPQTDGAGHTLGLYYNVSEKGHFGDDWKFYYYTASNSAYTSIVYIANHVLPEPQNTMFAPQNGKLDFQVQAIVGYYHEVWVGVEGHIAGSYVTVFTGQASDWSNTQTLPISYGINLTVQPSSNEIDPPAPSVPELSWLAIVPLLLSMFSAVMVLRHRKNR
jgi:hypothetical protein